jgi:transcriptional regulator with XRE-family HTH domain
VSRWERGANRPHDETLFALAGALGVDVSAFHAEHEVAA